jgi:hypothetical protein
MTNTVSGVLLGTFKSIVRGVLVCSEALASQDIITVAHQLGACPDIMLAVPRSALAQVSNAPIQMAVRSWNASQVIFESMATGGAGARGAQFDFICELTWAPAR